MQANTLVPDPSSSTSTQSLFSILIPVYNEQAYLARVVESVIAAPIPSNLSRELVLVDDCSTDHTPDVICELVNKYPDVIKAFRQPYNQGKGAAIRRAIQEMKGDFAIIQDADLEYNPNEYSLILAPLLDGRADVVYGSRFATRETRKALQYHHKLGNLFLTHLSNITTGLDLTDMETCYKAFRGDALKSIPLRSNRFGMEPEITAKIAKRGWTVYEVPISYNGRRYSEGKKIGWKDGVSAIYTILKYWFYDDSFYDADTESSLRLESSRNFLKTLVKRSMPYLGTRILEIGAGYGSLSRYIPQKESLVLADENERCLKFLRGSYEGNAVVSIAKLNLQRGESSNQSPEVPILDFPPASFDSIVCLNRTVELPLNSPESLRDIRPYLASDGKLVFTVLATTHSCLSCSQKDSKSLPSFRPKEIATLLEDAGYKVDKIEPIVSIQRFFRKTDPNKTTSRFGFKLFDLLVPRTQFLDKILRPIRYFVVASPKE